MESHMIKKSHGKSHDKINYGHTFFELTLYFFAMSGL